jgi:hypothetical protein
MVTAHRAPVTTFTTPAYREIVMTRVVAAPRRLVFEAWTGMESGASESFDRLAEYLGGLP